MPVYEPQPIRAPFGISVFGSSLIGVNPDVASLSFSVSRTENLPKDAFRSAKDAARNVRVFLNSAAVSEVSSSRVTLTQESKFIDGAHQFAGYCARVEFHVVVDDLDRVEDILIGVVDEGANHVSAVSFQSRNLKSLRAQARAQAVRAAREKAENFCAAAGIRLGPVLHLEDINPDYLGTRHDGHFPNDNRIDAPEEFGSFDPGAIIVAGAVRIGFSIKPDQAS